MNIQEAKREVKRSVEIYLAKDEFGNYRIPVEKQRPIFLVGAPGIGKTAIMEQIAEEMNISLVTYSMTHHTRQSALGLPFIVHKEFDGKPYDVTNYTMSEIISSIYDSIEESGIREGILFLDEINCISETLAPSMLQFLQYKTFGTHRVPEGWAIVTAGNPPEYNRSVREFDVVTLDRLRLLEITPDFEAWKYYAEKRGIHKAILTYLEIRQDDFYHMENTAREKRYVTARGWEDLSEAIYLYEEKGFPIDEILIGQYIRSPRIAREFATYYALYEKYKSDYQIPAILSGEETAEIRDRALKAGFDERLTLTGLLLEAIQPRIRKHEEKEEALKMLHGKLAALKQDESLSVHDRLQKLKDGMEREQKQKKAAGNLSRESKRAYAYSLNFIRACWDRLDQEGKDQPQADFALVNQEFQSRVQEMLSETPVLSNQLDHIFTFVEHVFGDDNEMLVLVTELTVDKDCASFIAENGCDGYYRHNKRLMVFERNQELMEEIEEMQKKGRA
ncbi:MAG: AAA family ATPase [Lachnospiraceae bacterium]|nr:AAA family ATPase [Lachnospiraceae bacterium]